MPSTTTPAPATHPTQRRGRGSRRSSGSGSTSPDGSQVAASARMRNRLVILAALLLSACVSPAATPSSSPTPSPSASPSPSESSSPISTAAPTGIVFTNAVLGYRIDTPPPWRRSACLSTRDQSKLPAGDGFVRVPEQDEKGTDVGYVFDVVQVQVHPNPERLTPERWLALGLIGGSATQSTEAATLDGHSALLL